MLKVLGKCILFGVLVAGYVKELLGVEFGKVGVDELIDGGGVTLRLGLWVLFLGLAVLAFLEVKNAVWLIIFELSYRVFSIYSKENRDLVVLKLILISGLFIYYSKISELKPLNIKRAGFK